MITHFQCNMCHFQKMKGRDLNRLRQEYDRMIIIIFWALLDAFLSWAPGRVRLNINMLIKMGIIAKEEVELEVWFPLMGSHKFKNEVGMGAVYVILRFSLIKGRYIGHLQ